MPPTAGSNLTPKHLTKQEFGRRLYNLMLKKGWRQSELARQADLPRDSVSTYVRGQSLPTPLSAQKLANALNVPVEELMPNHMESAIDNDQPAVEMRASASDPGKAWLRVNQLVPTSIAVDVLVLLNGNKASN